MKIILLEHVRSLGQKGEVKEVSDGYFQNFLSPRRLARPATATLVSHVHAQQAKAVEKLEMLKESAQAVFEKVNGKSVNVVEKASEGGKLYASVSAKEIAAAMKAQLKVEIPEKNIEIPTQIKSTGVFPVTLKLYKDLNAELLVNVAAA